MVGENTNSRIQFSTTTKDGLWGLCIIASVAEESTKKESERELTTRDCSVGKYLLLDEETTAQWKFWCAGIIK